MNAEEEEAAAHHQSAIELDVSTGRSSDLPDAQCSVVPHPRRSTARRREQACKHRMAGPCRVCDLDRGKPRRLREWQARRLHTGQRWQSRGRGGSEVAEGLSGIPHHLPRNRTHTNSHRRSMRVEHTDSLSRQKVHVRTYPVVLCAVPNELDQPVHHPSCWWALGGPNIPCCSGRETPWRLEREDPKTS